eukprot:gene7186-1284_t
MRFINVGFSIIALASLVYAEQLPPHPRLEAHGTDILAEKPVNDTRHGVEHSLLATARTTLDRLLTLGLLFRLDTNTTQQGVWLDRAVCEMRAVAAFKDWKLSDVLDPAEFSHAMARGYDWMWSGLSPEDKTTIENGIIANGINAVLFACYVCFAHHSSVEPCDNARFSDEYNWNLVCNGGLLTAAYAIIDCQGCDPANKAQVVIQHAVKGAPVAMRSYSWDGAWPEGPTYWGYATKYASTLIDSLNTSTGSDLGLGRTPGFSETGLFYLYSQGPSGHLFNWADAAETEAQPADLMWLGYHFPAHPEYAWMARSQISATTTCGDFCALVLMAYSTAGSKDDLDNLPPSRLFPEKAVGFLKNQWFDPSSPGISEATFLGIKGCNGEANHGDLDAGTWVYDAFGARWAIDLGSDDYGLPGYFTKESRPGARFGYYRKGTHGHNTLAFNRYPDALWTSNQQIEAFSNISSFDPDLHTAVVNMSAAYSHQGVVSAIRSFRTGGPLGSLEVTDDVIVASSSPVHNVTWTMQTRAHASITNSSVVRLVYGDPAQTMCLTCLAGGLAFSVSNVSLAVPQNSAQGIYAVRGSTNLQPGSWKSIILLAKCEQEH